MWEILTDFGELIPLHDSASALWQKTREVGISVLGDAQN